MNTTDIGKEAENAAANYLLDHGYKIIDRNFRTPRCEIDIIAQRNDCLYFVEVKFRSSGSQGTGLDYVTAKKLSQMRYAAETWLQTHDWEGEMVLSAVEVDYTLKVTAFIEDIS